MKDSGQHDMTVSDIMGVFVITTESEMISLCLVVSWHIWLHGRGTERDAFSWNCGLVKRQTTV